MSSSAVGRFVADVAEAVESCADVAAFRRWALDRVAREVGCDSAILVSADVWQPPATLNKEAFRHLYWGYARDPARYRRGLDKGLAAANAARGAYLDTDVFTSSERRQLPLYAEIVQPQRISSQVIGHLRLRERPLGTIHLCRHGQSARLRPRDVDRVADLLPAVALGLRALEGRTPPANDGALGELTAREAQVVQLVCRGLTNPEIARLLGTRPSTVRNQLHGIFDKVGVASRTELAYWAMQRHAG